jgi:NAD+ kinase
MDRLGIVVHPTRAVEPAVDALRRWTAAREVELVQLQVDGNARTVAALGEVSACDLVVAVGGDGTVLTALHAAARTRTPVVGVTCGSLAALATLSPADLDEGLDRFARGEWSARRLPALAANTPRGVVARAINDLALMRRGGTQLMVAVSVGDELYAHMAGDGIVVATALGSSAYSMASGGPVLVPGTRAFVCHAAGDARWVCPAAGGAR